MIAQLDNDQLPVVVHNGGFARVLAGPGAGKTRTLVGCVESLLRRVSPKQILCVTFSVVAAEEMRSRVLRATGARDLPRAMFSTFHSAALRILLCERERLPFKLSYDPVLAPSGLRQLLRCIGVQRDDMAPARRELARLRSIFAEPSVRGAELYCAYHRALEELGKVDFASMVYWAVRQIEENPYSAANWVGRYRHVLVDEAHDTSRDQATLARLLARDGNLIAFGDESQRVYSFRFACNDLLGDDSGETYVLPNNYRSGESIVETFRPLAEPGPLAEEMRAARAGGSVEFSEHVTAEAEASATADHVQLSVSHGAKPESIAVLARTRALLAPIADELDRRNVNYFWRGRNFWQSHEVQDVLAWVRIARDLRDRKSLRRAILSSTDATKYLGRKFADAAIAQRDDLPQEVPGPWSDSQLERWSDTRGIILGFGALPKACPSLWVRSAVDLFWAVAPDDEPDDFRQENLQQLIIRASKFVDIDQFLEHAKRAEADKRSGVVLSTIHGAKGLEFNEVFVIAVSKNLLPHRKAEDEDEERRLLYVALSRARDRLVVSHFGEASPLWTLMRRTEVVV